MNDADVRRRNHWVNHIARHAHEKPGAVYLRFQGVSVTWSQLHDRVSAVAAAMARRGVNPELNAVSTVVVAGLGALILISERLRKA